MGKRTPEARRLCCEGKRPRARSGARAAQGEGRRASRSRRWGTRTPGHAWKGVPVALGSEALKLTLARKFSSKRSPRDFPGTGCFWNRGWSGRRRKPGSWVLSLFGAEWSSWCALDSVAGGDAPLNVFPAPRVALGQPSFQASHQGTRLRDMASTNDAEFPLALRGDTAPLPRSPSFKALPRYRNASGEWESAMSLETLRPSFRRGFRSNDATRKKKCSGARRRQPRRALRASDKLQKRRVSSQELASGFPPVSYAISAQDGMHPVPPALVHGGSCPLISAPMHSCTTAPLQPWLGPWPWLPLTHSRSLHRA